MIDIPDGDTRVTLPIAWRAAFIWQQLVVLALAGVAFFLATLSSPVYQALFSRVPDIPLFIVFVPAEVIVPLIAPALLGLPLVLTRHRAPLLLWIALVVLLAFAAVVEVSRLNWVSFVSGLAFRVASGPVPILRTVGGLALIMSGAALLAHQSVHVSLLHLAERGVTRKELGEVRTGLLGLERAVIGVTFAAGIALTLIAAVSMSITEGAPEQGGSVTIWLLWTLILVALLVGALYWGAKKRAA